jgi:hypothetical protein
MITLVVALAGLMVGLLIGGAYGVGATHSVWERWTRQLEGVLDEPAEDPQLGVPTWFLQELRRHIQLRPGVRHDL